MLRKRGKNAIRKFDGKDRFLHLWRFETSKRTTKNVCGLSRIIFAPENNYSADVFSTYAALLARGYAKPSSTIFHAEASAWAHPSLRAESADCEESS
jgi:hypothetical protein